MSCNLKLSKAIGKIMWYFYSDLSIYIYCLQGVPRFETEKRCGETDRTFLCLYDKQWILYQTPCRTFGQVSKNSDRIVLFFFTNLCWVFWSWRIFINRFTNINFDEPKGYHVRTLSERCRDRIMLETFRKVYMEVIWNVTLKRWKALPCIQGSCNLRD